MQNTYETLATVAVFRELYDQKKDIYDVLATYIKDIIVNEKLISFTCSELTKKINDANSFDINESVVKTALKRLDITRNGGLYDASSFDLENDSDKKYFRQRQENERLLENLFLFISNEKNIVLSDKEKNKIKDDFYEYLLNSDKNTEYSLLIHKYIISVDSSFISIINKIKEGILIYEGICFNSDLNELGQWKTKLNIYLEQETLFYIAGYNGEIHKELYGNLLSYIKEVNKGKSEKNRLINLWYTSDVNDEIDTYFMTAEHILERSEVIDPSKKPMLYILENAKTRSDVVAKKMKFFNILKQYGINLFEYQFYDKKNYEYSIVDKNVYEKHNDLICEKDNEYIEKCTDKLNQIEILRKNKNKGFNNIEHILLTANSTILKLAYSDVMYKWGDVPKATDVDFLINRFWFKLNKGFGKGKTPKSIDVVTRSRIVLSFLTNDKVSKKFEEVMDEYHSEKINKEQAIALVADLRAYSKTPDEIDDATINTDINYLTDFDINKRIEEYKREQIERENDKNSIKELKEEIEKLKSEKKETELINEEKLEKLQKRIISDNKDMEELHNQLSSIREQIRIEKQEREERKMKIKFRIGLAIRIIISIIIFAIIFIVLVHAVKVEKSWSGVLSIVISLIFGFVDIKKFIKGKKLKD